jgi:outer membrane lipoprotein-sorting protein
LPACPSERDAPDPTALLRRVEYTLEGSSSVGTMTMVIKTPAWSRTLTMKTWSKGKDYALVRVLKGGPRETGMMTLKRGKQLWHYLPQAGRVMKLPSGMLGDSWMGSDFTNDDLVRGTSLTRDFDAKVTQTLEHQGQKAWRLVLVPRPSATVVWGKMEMVLDRATCVPLLERFFDEEGKLARTMSFSDLRAIGWRRFPGRMAVKPAEGNRETIVTYGELEFDGNVPDDTFSLHRLQQGK